MDRKTAKCLISTIDLSVLNGKQYHRFDSKLIELAMKCSGIEHHVIIIMYHVLRNLAMHILTNQLKLVENEKKSVRFVCPLCYC